MDFFDELKELGTIVKNISGIYNQYKSKIVSDFDSIEKQYESIKDELDKAGKENSQKIIVDGKEFDKVRTIFQSNIKNIKSFQAVSCRVRLVPGNLI